MTDIVYAYGDKVYLNLTNKCPCKCEFCIRGGADGLGSADNLWFTKDPTFAEIKAALDAYDFTGYTGEVVFCGYGEPLCALENLLKTARYIKETYGFKLRLNTNGLGDLIHKKPVAPLLKGLIDSVSISLNAPDRDAYDALVHPAFGPDAFDAMLRFAESCKGNIPEIQFSVVDVIPPEQIERCRALARRLDIPLRVRVYSENA